jgi:rare lipoprotein A
MTRTAPAPWRYLRGLAPAVIALLAACAGAPPRPTAPPPPAATDIAPVIAPAAAVAAPTLAPGAVPPPPADLAAIPDAVPRVEPRSALGNPPFYDVAGKRYFVLANAEGYKERGVASWYGPTFHEKNASNGDAYDMYAMTAAHKTLPLPAYVRVTNLANGRSVVVRVNDRGPFVGTRIIDLSYTAAWKLDMLRQGTAFVEVEALTPGTLSTTAAAVAPPSPAGLVSTATLYIQAGAFGVEDNARRLADRLRAAGIATVALREPGATSRLWRVRIGPVADVATYDRILLQLQGLGVEGRLASD